MRLSVGLCAVWALLSAGATEGKEALPPSPPAQTTQEPQPACEGGQAVGCFNLGVRYVQGKGVPQDERRAATLFEQACKGGVSQACSRR